MSQEFSNHLNNHSFDNFTPQVTKDRTIKIISALIIITVLGVVIHQIHKNNQEKNNKSI